MIAPVRWIAVLRVVVGAWFIPDEDAALGDRHRRRPVVASALAGPEMLAVACDL